MLEATRNYVARTLPRLPNFLATRSINRYDDSPQELKKMDAPPSPLSSRAADFPVSS
jgi:hypothetical protein